MNIKSIINWLAFIVIIGLIIWGLIAASNKAEKKNASLPLPSVVSATDWVKGNPEATITIVEYSDFQCPACALYYPIVERLINESSTTIRFVYRHFPLTQHANAIPAAQSAEAAGKQGKFWEMYSMIFDTQDEWTDSKDVKKIFANYAVKLGLDIEKYNTDIVSKEIMDKINSDMKSGVKAGINSTPTFYVNGEKIENPQGYDDFKKVIDNAKQTEIKSS